MFDAIAHRYDLLNRVLSMGIDQRWRKKTVAALHLPEAARVLDLATGTGDVALRIAHAHQTAQVTGVDPSENMLAVGRTKVAAAGLSERITLSQGDAEQLPFPDRTFHGVSIAFGIRNVPDRARALREMARVCRPGGRVAILELSEPRGGVLGALARFHVHTLVPTIGALLSGAREYRYLQQSIAAFPPAEQFAAQLQSCGLQVLQVVPLTFGVCHLYVAQPQP
jgi:demethylmenaquinone methyltransferase/2-methoxy-6-polyprenyl-1,4-benzoquinol methylase